MGNCPALLDLLRRVDQVAPTDSSVLIYGETGTGKELIARAIHNRSARKKRPSVKVNCSAISAGLVESELFGHVKGAFTGAFERRIGRFELADGGTRSFWMKLVSCLWRLRLNYCACYRNVNLSQSAVTVPCALTYGLSPPQIEIFRSQLVPGVSARISIID